jgi:hypothetical protein
MPSDNHSGCHWRPLSPWPDRRIAGFSGCDFGFYDTNVAAGSHKGEDPFFAPMGRQLLLCLLAHLVWADPHTVEISLATLADALAKPEQDMLDNLKGIARLSRSPLARRIAAPETFFAGVALNASKGASWLFTSAYADLVSRGRFNPKMLLAGRTTNLHETRRAAGYGIGTPTGYPRRRADRCTGERHAGAVRAGIVVRPRQNGRGRGAEPVCAEQGKGKCLTSKITPTIKSRPRGKSVPLRFGSARSTTAASSARPATTWRRPSARNAPKRSVNA